MATSGPRVSWNIQNKVLYIGVESRGREHRWKLSANSIDKAAILREIADVLDPPERPRRRAPRVVEHYGDDYYDDDDEEDDREWEDRPHGPMVPRRRRRPNQQVREPYPPIDPLGEFSGDAEFIDHSRGYTPDGRAIPTPVPRDPAEREAMARLSREAFEKGQAHAGAVAGQDPEVNNLPIIEARPKEVRRTQPLDSQGRGFLPPTPSDTPGLSGQVQVRKRPSISDPQFYFKDTH